MVLYQRIQAYIRRPREEKKDLETSSPQVRSSSPDLSMKGGENRDSKYFMFPSTSTSRNSLDFQPLSSMENGTATLKNETQLRPSE